MLVLASLAFPLLFSQRSTPYHGMKNNRANAEKMDGNRSEFINMYVHTQSVSYGGERFQ